MATATQVQQTYLAYFGRPADPAGLQYWMGLDVATMQQGFAGSAEYANLYAGMSVDQRVDQVYANLLGRASDAAGKAYWVAHMKSGAVTVSDLVVAVQAGAQSTDIDTITNRITYSTLFTAALDTPAEVAGYSGYAACAAARAVVSAVTCSAASLATAESTLNADIVSVSTGVAPATTTGGGSATAATFTVTESNAHVLEFGGTALGAITVSITGTGDATSATFTRDGVAATAVLLKTVTGVQDAAPLNLTVANFNVLTSMLEAADAITIADTGTALQANLPALVGSSLVDKIDVVNANGSALAGALTVGYTAVAATEAKLANDTLVVNDIQATLQAHLIALVADAKVSSIDVVKADGTASASTLTVGYAAVTGTEAKLVNDTLIVKDVEATLQANVHALVIDANVSKIDVVAANGNSSFGRLTVAAADVTVAIQKLVDDALDAGTGNTSLTGATGSSAADVSEISGHQWFFAADVGGVASADELTYWNGSSATTVTITGVRWVSLVSGGAFDLTLE